MSIATIYSPLGDKNVVVTSYQIGITGILGTAQGASQLFAYPIRARQEPFTFTIQCRSEAEKEDIIEFVRDHQQKAVEGGTYAGQVRFFWFEEKLDFLGFVKQIRAGAVRFQPAPTLQLELILVKDLVYRRSSVSSSGAAWTGVYDGEVSLNPPGTNDGSWHWVEDENGQGHWAPGPDPGVPQLPGPGGGPHPI